MIYAVHQGTKAHRRIDSVNGPISAYEAVVKADADGWIEWSGDDKKNAPLSLRCKHEIKVVSGRTYERPCPTQTNWSGDTSVIAYRPTIDQPASEESKGWDGEGLPPVGTMVGVIDDGTLRYGADECGPVVAHVENTAVVRMSYGLGCFKANYLAPIRTDRERWIEAALKAGGLRARDGAIEVYGALYDAGLAKLPGDNHETP